MQNNFQLMEIGLPMTWLLLDSFNHSTGIYPLAFTVLVAFILIIESNKVVKKKSMWN